MPEVLVFPFTGAEFPELSRVLGPSEEEPGPLDPVAAPRLSQWRRDPVTAFVQQVKHNLYLFEQPSAGGDADDNGFGSDMIDVFGRDYNAFYQEDARARGDFDVELYVVVLLHMNKYYGHIYTWISPEDANICLAMGIRARVDQLSIKGTPEELSRVSALLLEGVRRFAKHRGCEEMYLVLPLAVMEKLAKRLGFVNEELNGTIVGSSISGPGDDEDYSCMKNDDLETVLDERLVDYTEYA